MIDGSPDPDGVAGLLRDLCPKLPDRPHVGHAGPHVPGLLQMMQEALVCDHLQHQTVQVSVLSVIVSSVSSSFVPRAYPFH